MNALPSKDQISSERKNHVMKLFATGMDDLSSMGYWPIMAVNEM